MIEKFLAKFLKGVGLTIPKKAPWCIFLRRAPGRWENMNPAGNSARRCGKAAKKYKAAGIPDIDMMILPKGISPP